MGLILKVVVEEVFGESDLIGAVGSGAYERHRALFYRLSNLQIPFAPLLAVRLPFRGLAQVLLLKIPGTRTFVLMLLFNSLIGI